MEIIVKILSLSILTLAEGWTDTKQRKFADNFMFGAGTAAYQVEGAWNVNGKGENIWDRYFHDHPELVTERSHASDASDSYHQYQRDVEMLRELGVDHYRFSISWARLFPTGFINSRNEEGFQYYDNLINELRKYNIEPMVTIYHFDLPQYLQDLGGWSNPLSVVWFEDYAAEVYKRYADKVKWFVTVNQPNTICIDGYGDTSMAPGVNVKGVADYLCIKNVLLAHAKAYRLYEREYKKKYKGQVGIALAINWADPFNNKTENVKATEEYREFSIGLYMNPIWSAEGDFPKVVKDIIDKKSFEQGFRNSRLPVLANEEKKLLKGSADFLGMNHYTTFLVKRPKNNYSSPSFADDANVDLTHGKEWLPGKSTWLRSVPYGLYKVCLYLNKQYSYPPIFITEHGWSTDKGLGDQSRVTNMRGYLSALLLAIEDGTDVRGYTYWSLLDNLEWAQGISERFGLYEVDFDSANKTRTARLSAFAYKRIIESRSVEDGWEPPNLQISISDRRTKKIRAEL